MPVGPGETPVTNPDDSTASNNLVGRSQVVYLQQPTIIGEEWPEYGRAIFEVEAISTTSVVSKNIPLVVRANASAGAVTVTLPKVSEVPNAFLIVVKVDNSANAVTVAIDASETWYGANAAKTLASQWSSVTLIGTFDPDQSVIGWHVISTT